MSDQSEAEKPTYFCNDCKAHYDPESIVIRSQNPPVYECPDCGATAERMTPRGR